MRIAVKVRVWGRGCTHAVRWRRAISLNLQRARDLSRVRSLDLVAANHQRLHVGDMIFENIACLLFILR